MDGQNGATLCISRVLLTGPPGIGKSTICKEIISNLKEQTHKVDGFYTEEVRNDIGNRIGFDVVPINSSGRKLTLARVKDVIDPSQRSKYKVGNYYVFLSNLETVALPVFDSTADILIIDEIGKMELFSQKFHDKILKLFSGSRNEPFIIATIPEMHKIPQRYLSLFQNLQADKKSKVITVNRENRDSLVKEIVRLIL
ncbi:Cancer-related nucleoside-triphosphatase like protein [Dufourea novaeangliae]|uniref:Cancer-related nucleoside-triphosphatase like protein n=2 Tax=Dufourea novaeangliae TaxID=178035 RepID=A0A154PDY2_DUFNO|nr:Cancer-related nucleoside-triphosphatase like protein [Dufourea novaeangliae]